MTFTDRFKPLEWNGTLDKSKMSENGRRAFHKAIVDGVNDLIQPYTHDWWVYGPQKPEFFIDLLRKELNEYETKVNMPMATRAFIHDIAVYQIERTIGRFYK